MDDDDNDFRFNSLYLYTFISNNNNNDNKKYDKPLLLNYIYFETCPQRLNHFENFFWREKQQQLYIPNK